MKYIFLSFFLILIFSGCKKDKTSFFNSWKLKSYLKGPGEVVVNAGFKFEVSFNKDSVFSTQLDYNSCEGSFYKGSSELNILGGSCTALCCDSLNSKEVLTLFLDSVNEYEISGKQLKLRGDNFISLTFELSK